MSWFKRLKEGITTSTREKKDVPEGVWHKCTGCKKNYRTKELVENLHVCPYCDHHERISSSVYFSILFDEQKYERLFDDLTSYDFLEFTDLKSYGDRLQQADRKTGLSDAISVASGKVYEKDLVVAAMDFKYVGGSMGSVVGEKISRAVNHCIAHKTPLIIISKSGGARMMESAFSLMQMAKTAAKLTQLGNAGLPYFSLMTDPTTGGVTASYSMLGDINMAEPGALIGFAGPRVIKETIKKDLPKGFQRSEFLLEGGFLDFIVDRRLLKEKIAELIILFQN